MKAMNPTNINSVASSQNSNHISPRAKMAFNASRNREMPNAPQPALKHALSKKEIDEFVFSDHKKAALNASSAIRGRIRRS